MLKWLELYFCKIDEWSFTPYVVFKIVLCYQKNIPVIEFCLKIRWILWAFPSNADLDILSPAEINQLELVTYD